MLATASRPSCTDADNDPLNNTDPLGLRPEDDGDPFDPDLDDPEPGPTQPDNGSSYSWYFQHDVMRRAMRGQINPPSYFYDEWYGPTFLLDVDSGLLYVKAVGNDGCSVPLAAALKLACDVHDYGYDLLRAADELGHQSAFLHGLREDADLVMYEIAGEICGWQPIVAKPGCQLERQAAYRALQRLTDWEGGAPR